MHACMMYVDSWTIKFCILRVCLEMFFYGKGSFCVAYFQETFLGAQTVLVFVVHNICVPLNVFNEIISSWWTQENFTFHFRILISKTFCPSSCHILAGGGDNLHKKFHQSEISHKRGIQFITIFHGRAVGSLFQYVNGAQRAVMELLLPPFAV